MRQTLAEFLSFAFLVCLVSTHAVHARALQSPLIPATKEPTRFAFVVGNGGYQFAFSNLADLTDTCDEAINFRKELLALGWQEDHIYPLVHKTAAQTENESIAAAICDLKNSDLTDGLSDFINRLLINQDNPYGVVYYAGHGAQSNDEFYAFGVDANVDLTQEIDLVTHYPNYEIFSRPSAPDKHGTTAVDLTRIIKSVNGPKGKALLVILNACRNDPVLDDFMVSRKDLSTLDPETRKRLSLGYINTKPDKYDKMFQNIIVMFAGRPEQPANGGTASQPNWFSQQLIRYMQDTSNQEAPTPIFVSDFETVSKKDQLSLPELARQIPSHIGSMARRPVYCLKGCSQPLPVWANEKVEIIIADIKTPQPNLMIPSKGRRHTLSSAGQPSLLLTSLGQAPAANQQPEVMPSNLSSLHSHPINLDVFYCSGDASVAGQEDAARKFAETTRREEPVSTTVSGTYIGQIRLRSIDINTNLAMKHPYVGTSLVLEKSNPASKAWATRLGTSFGRVYMDDVTQGFIRAYFCEGFSPTQKPRPLVYTQVAQANQIGPAKKLLSQLSEDLPGMRFIDKVEPVDDTHPGSVHSPNTTQIRYYIPEELHDAEAIAAQLRQRVTNPISVVWMHIANPQVKRNPVIEIWFGRDEMALWPAVPPSQ